MKYEVTNAFYFGFINKIGGVESFFYYLGKKYSNTTNITIFYRTADAKQLLRIRKHAQCIRLKPGDTIKCENLFCNYAIHDVLDIAEAKHAYVILHGDYLDMVNRGQQRKDALPIDDRIEKYLGVSKHVCKTWEQLTGIKAEYVGEPVTLDEVQKPLLFVSATRLTREKGWERMQKLARALNTAGLNYTWFIYTNARVYATVENMVIMPPILNITDKLGMFDAVIQLSDNEGFNLTCVEGLLRGVPFIGTKLPVYEEIGLTDENSILLDLEMRDIPVEAIANIREKKFTYKQPADRWGKYLKKEDPSYKKGLITIRATAAWTKHNLIDAELGITPPEGAEWEVTKERYQQLTEYQNLKSETYIQKVEKGK